MATPGEPGPNDPGSARRPFFGWWVVGAATIYSALMGGLNHTGLSLYFLPLTREFGISYTKVSLLFSLRSLEGGLEGPIAGFFADRLGPRVMVIAGVLLGGAGFILLAMTQTYVQFLLVLLFMVTIGFSLPDHGTAVAINHWFRRRLGLAMSVASSGGLAIGGFLLTPIVAWVVLTHSWRWAGALSGLLMLAVGLPLTLFIRRPSAGETNLDERPVLASSAPSKAPVAVSGDIDGPPSAASSAMGDFAVGEALRTKTYWLLALAIGLRLMAQTALLVHMVPILVAKGLGEGVAGALVAAMAFFRLPSSLGAGFLADRWSRQRVVTLAMGSGVLAAATVLWGPSGLGTGALFALLFGTAHSSNAITWALVGQFYGRKSFGTLRGGVSLIPSLMSTIGPIAAGRVFDQTGSYSGALVGIAGTYILAGALFWVLKTPTKPSQDVT